MEARIRALPPPYPYDPPRSTKPSLVHRRVPLGAPPSRAVKQNSPPAAPGNLTHMVGDAYRLSRLLLSACLFVLPSLLRVVAELREAWLYRPDSLVVRLWVVWLRQVISCLAVALAGILFPFSPQASGGARNRRPLLSHGGPHVCLPDHLAGHHCQNQTIGGGGLALLILNPPLRAGDIVQMKKPHARRRHLRCSWQNRRQVEVQGLRSGGSLDRVKFNSRLKKRILQHRTSRLPAVGNRVSGLVTARSTDIVAGAG